MTETRGGGQMAPDDQNRVAIVTGGGTWIGSAITEVLSRGGMSVVIAGRRKEPIENTARRLTGAGGQVAAVPADIREKQGRQKIVDTCLEKFGRIDVLVNNAATSHFAPLLDYAEDDWNDVVKTNLDAAFFLSQLAFEDMRKRHWGRVVNIASVFGNLALNNSFYPNGLPMESPGDRGPVRASAYHASKGALINLTRELAVAAAPWGITVNVVSPGMIPPNQSEGGICDIKAMKQMTPVGRLGRPEDIAYAVKYFASEEASFTTGAELVVDGGWSIW
jgi:NAD(P)-dependent dehydrogenase (short-subunit alcohol dehydrogenase family)